jgi:small subunit ribosomal protein S18
MRPNNRNRNQKYISNPAMLPQIFSKKTRKCPLTGPDADKIDYKNVALLKRFISERGKIIPRRITSVSSKKQRELAKAIKNARILALLPYVEN